MKSKILIIGPGTDKIGGISSFISGLITSELKQNYQFQIMDMLELKKRDNLKKRSRFIVFDIAGSLRFIKKYISTLREKSISIVHINSSSKWSFYEKLILLIIAKMFKKKTIFQIHSGSFPSFYKKNKFKNLLSWILSFSDSIVCVSTEINKVIGLPNSETILNGISIPPDYEKKTNYDKITFISVCLLEKNKKIDRIILAVEKLVKSGVKRFKLLIAGEGGEKENLLQIIKDKKLKDYVEYIGTVKDLQKENLYKASDVYISFSDFESFGISVAEAMSYKLLIISTKTGIAKKHIINEQNGYLVNFDDIDDLASKMSKIIKQKISFELGGKINYDVVLKNYSLNKIAQKFDKVYFSLLSK